MSPLSLRVSGEPIKPGEKETNTWTIGEVTKKDILSGGDSGYLCPGRHDVKVAFLFRTRLDLDFRTTRAIFSQCRQKNYDRNNHF